ncbi:uncharacterized protein CTHT_0005950 [Thermochaetoides thermophila DSM 1495]|uniref:Uncharacterized protein n=1 Tax=Chaetomium thermophilum (strain DSM 1495 / CBS 144.50 / IMI 039719) TaxID=759272 RepID=G0RYA0_CHATD|nr:hypothetical protein CTHT_0005950 [Thermochaetoides thermophila DSM 1495]EGS23886.1 hypothetical protein CTHT_0005950 [Thermochaetoides thermophila DSM 1495]
MNTNSVINPGQGLPVDPNSIPASLTNDPEGFKKFDSYPWEKDRQFLQGLNASLGPIISNQHDMFMRQKALSITLQSRIWWYKSHFGCQIDRIKYEAWTLNHPETNPDHKILKKLDEIRKIMGLPPAVPVPDPDVTKNIPEWQLNAPKCDLSKKAEDVGGRSTEGGAPYPEDFQALVEAVTQGKPIPGIREIPNKVVRPPGISPYGKAPAPPKPWEKNRAGENTQKEWALQGVCDKEFPPLEEDNSNDTTEKKDE